MLCLCILAGLIPTAVFAAASNPFDAQERSGVSPIGLTADDWTEIQSLLPPASPSTQDAYIKATNPGPNDAFGYALAISGNTLVVGAYLEDSNAPGVNGNQSDNSMEDSGAAYVFIRSGGVWSQQAYLKASNPGVDDFFGSSVAISGDTIVVGAYREDSNATGVNGGGLDLAEDSGAAYVFTRSGGVWSQQAYLKASNTDAYDYFGYSVAVSGGTIVVGARNEDSNAIGVNGNQSNNTFSRSGAAYVFTRSGGVWSQQAYLKASNTGAEDFFGEAVAISGDTIVAGARNEDSDATGVNGGGLDLADDAGAAYVFTRSGGVWSQQAYLKASNTGAYDEFGWSLAISSDTIVIGAHYEDSNATGVNGGGLDLADDSGAAYVFTRSGGVWSQQAYLKASNTGTGDDFGYSVAISGNTIIAGAYLEDSNATGVNGNQGDNSINASGAAYVFTRSGGVWSQQEYLKASNTGDGDRFGRSVAVYGGLVAVGTRWEDSNATGVNGNQTNDLMPNSGAAYVFTGFASTLPETGFAPRWINVLPQQYESYSDYGSLRLQIPSLGVETGIVGVPSDWDVRWLGGSVGWLRGTAFPTWAGNTVLTAHVYGSDGLPGPFVDLGDLRWGDDVVIHAWGLHYRYEVRQNFLVRPTSDFPLQHEEYDWVTLLTCERYDEAQGQYAYRRVVRAVLVDVRSE